MIGFTARWLERLELASYLGLNAEPAQLVWHLCAYLRRIGREHDKNDRITITFALSDTRDAVNFHEPRGVVTNYVRDRQSS